MAKNIIFNKYKCNSILIGLAGPTALRFDWRKKTAVIFKFQQQQKPGRWMAMCCTLLNEIAAEEPIKITGE